MAGEKRKRASKKVPIPHEQRPPTGDISEGEIPGDTDENLILTNEIFLDGERRFDLEAFRAHCNEYGIDAFSFEDLAGVAKLALESGREFELPGFEFDATYTYFDEKGVVVTRTEYDEHMTEDPNCGYTLNVDVIAKELRRERNRDDTNNSRKRSKNKHKRTIPWSFGSEDPEDDEYNIRGTDGRITKECLQNRGKSIKVFGVIPKKGERIPAEFITDDLLDLHDLMVSINGQADYDPETMALGDLDASLWFAIPANFEIPIPDANSVGKGNKVMILPFEVIAGVYVLAKRQLKNDAEAIKWAVLRMEAMKSGWYDNQVHTKRIELEEGFEMEFIRDAQEIKQHTRSAKRVCGLIPYILEHSFRSFGTTYSSGDKAEFLRRAENICKACLAPDLHSYMSHDRLYGQALHWIGPKRVMDVLIAQSKDRKAAYPNPIRVRMSAAPAGQAIVTSADAVIRAAQSGNWWSHIRKAGGYDESVLANVAKKIAENPWKYHMNHGVYGIEGLSKEDSVELEIARANATTYAPILQAYCNTMGRETELGRIQALKKAAKGNTLLLKKAENFFKAAGAQKTRTISALFSMEVFGINPDDVGRKQMEAVNEENRRLEAMRANELERKRILDTNAQDAN